MMTCYNLFYLFTYFFCHIVLLCKLIVPLCKIVGLIYVQSDVCIKHVDLVLLYDWSYIHCAFIVVSSAMSELKNKHKLHN
jgi:hypothetical protein